MAKAIPVGRGLFALVDDEDYDRVARHKWWVIENVSGNRYAMARIDGRFISMHRFILNPPSHLEVDHRDGNGLNNQKANLRLCTRQQNQWHRRGEIVWQDGTVTKGIYRIEFKDTVRWYARLSVKGSEWRSGPYKTREEAMRAYDEAARRILGEFAWTHAEGYGAAPKEGEAVITYRIDPSELPNESPSIQRRLPSKARGRIEEQEEKLRRIIEQHNARLRREQKRREQLAKAA